MTSSAKKFELLSAYLDNEASLEDACLVEQWLASDPSLSQQYRAQQKLKAAIQSLGADIFDPAIATKTYAGAAEDTSHIHPNAPEPSNSCTRV